MRFRINPKKLIVPALNAAAIAGIIITSAAGSAFADSQNYNYVYNKWKGQSTESFSQMSCYFSEDAGFQTNMLRSIKGQFLSKLKDAAYDTDNPERLLIDSYSALIGESKVTCDITRKSNAQITAVGGDFFYFHDFELVNGCYYRIIVAYEQEIIKGQSKVLFVTTDDEEYEYTCAAFTT